ncbi:NitT/TauT family transport system permease protein [Aeromonas sp. RU39B]|uniref:ABC transporter permease n=1 Tax=Aeromonas sp. RU39B TaxID=1907416 RepID=UPI0009539D26|nr:ABC transporter permease [Aeromonas sp. RU39B]SIP94654.1 NitT/TauT family transport system permease protein [Aeromonas sp. RU39B]
MSKPVYLAPLLALTLALLALTQGISAAALSVTALLLLGCVWALCSADSLAGLAGVLVVCLLVAWRLLVGDSLPLPASGYWLQVSGLALLAHHSVHRLAHLEHALAPQGAVAGLFGLWLLFFWQLLVTRFGVPQVLLPTPLAILEALLGNLGLLAGDVVQTVIKSVLVGYLLGCGAGIACGILIERFPFAQRGLLPLANLTSTIPLVGVAPIAVMWFGFDWPSKAAVIVLVTFFPALVSTLAGLQATGKLERELMHSYAATPRMTLLALRLPAAMPFIFNALKVNSALALISAIVAEYFGSPTAGLGFRISAEAARMHMPIVWAAIVVASLIGSGCYAVLVRLERRVTFWHPAIRSAH